MEYIKPSDMRAIDINSAYYGVVFSELMENAGRSVYEEIKQRVGKKDTSIVIICGSGNNGGDGLVVARYLKHDGLDPRVYLIGGREKIRTTEAYNALKELEKTGIRAIDITGHEPIDYNVDLIIEGLLGTGIRGEPREPYKSIIKGVNASKAQKISIDVPSGLGSNTRIHSNLVVALHKAKVGTENYETRVVDIGIPVVAETLTGPGDLIAFLDREKESHKGENGRVLIVAGSKDYYGAPTLAGLGALNSGSDLVTIFVPESIADSVRTGSPDFIVRDYPGDYLNWGAQNPIIDYSEGRDVCLIGPGLSLSPDIGDSVNKIISGVDIPLVIDADALKEMDSNLLKEKEAVITPHTAEFKALTGSELPRDDLEARKNLVRDWAVELNATILLKSPTDIITSPEGKIKLNKTGNPGMTKGGTGDVLAGLVAGFMSQGLSPFNAAKAGAFINGAAGDTLSEFKRYAYTASDLAKEIPYTMKRLFDLYT